MKKAIVVLLCLAGVTAMAQQGEKERRSAMNDMTPEQVATLKTKKMTLALDLTQAQQDQIQALNLKNAKMRKNQWEERKTRKEDTEAKKPAPEERFAQQNERLDRMIAHKAEMKEILSQEQYGKWEKMTQQKVRHRKGMHRKGKGQKRHTRK